ncbi:MAG: hypothetical protein ABL308_09005 [Oceanicaulis sp.]
MSFREKSNLAMLAIFLLAYGWYFMAVTPVALSGAPSIAEIDGLFLAAIVFLVAGGIVAHILIAIVGKDDEEDADERDRMIEMRADAKTSYVIGAAAIIAMGLALKEFDPFWIAHTILAGLVVAEITKAVLRAIAYRFGG